jgi:hypothetical protein
LGHSAGQPDPSAPVSRYESTHSPGTFGQTGKEQGQGTTSGMANSIPDAKVQSLGNTGTNGQGGHRHTRSRRMRKMKKNPVGTPPPGLEESEGGEELRPLSSLPPSTSWGLEGRERERGA